MIKILIVDDERIIRETIAALIDWKSLGMTLIGSAENGIDAYNIILDEYPDIVLTDIKMPGFSGLELIQRVHEISPNTQFIILSGYGEFEFAQKAMQYGVKHYLLKPCNEEQIISCLNAIKNEFLTNKTAASHPHSVSNIIIKNMLTYYLQANTKKSSFPAYSNNTYFSDSDNPYALFYIYYIEKNSIDKLSLLIQENISSDHEIYMLYVKGTFVLFCPYEENYVKEMETRLSTLHLPFQVTTPEIKSETFSTLHKLMLELSRHIHNYEVIYYYMDKMFLPIYNYHNVVKEMYRLADLIFSKSQDSSTIWSDDLISLFSDISDIDLLRQQASSLLIYILSKQTAPNVTEAMDFIFELNQISDISVLLSTLTERINAMVKNHHSNNSSGYVSQQIISCMESNLEKSELSLKWIAENYLFMNVDYLSKRFVKETGVKFSKYLTDLRMQKAKYYMRSGKYSIQEIADLVGCGQNPQYFSQIFKKKYRPVSKPVPKKNG